MTENERLGMKQVLDDLGIGESRDAFFATWDRSESAPDIFPDMAKLDEGLNILQMDEEISKAIRQTATEISSNPALKRLAWHCCIILAGLHDTENARIADWPKPSPINDNKLPPLFYAVAYTLSAPAASQKLASRGVTQTIIADTFSDLELWIKDFERRLGVFGLDQYSWLSRHFSERLLRLGRLQFEIKNDCFCHLPYRNTKTGKVIVLAEDGTEFRRDGQYNNANELPDDEPWTAHFSIEYGLIKGYPILPTGTASQNTVELDDSEWESIANSDSPALAIHIPAIGPMDVDACGESFRLAAKLFPEYFPKHNFKLFTCRSWLLDPQFEDYLKPESNIVRFLREFYLLPAPNASQGQTLERVLGISSADKIGTIEPKSSLQRAVVEHIKSGKQWRDTACILFAEDLERWGSGIYQ